MQPNRSNQKEGRWRKIQDAASYSGVSPSQLRKLKADESFSPGIEYCYLTGKKGGPVGWDPVAIEDWQIKQSQLIADAPKKAASEIETFTAMGDE
jgi:hypothetical protein